MNSFPRRRETAKIGEAGVNLVAKIINDDFGWIFRKFHQEDDFGLDGMIEYVDENGNVTGKTIAVQIKYGKSYVSAIDGNVIRFKGKLQHLNYWANSSSPVVIIVGDPKTKTLYWEVFDVDKTDAHGKMSWTIDIPLTNILNKKHHKAIKEIFGEVDDALIAAKEKWAINKLIKENDAPILFVVSKDDIERLNFESLENFFSRLMITREMVVKCRNKVWLSIGGYENDSRELWEIPEVLEWHRNSIPKIKYWLWFLDLSYRNCGFFMLYLSISNHERLGNLRGKIQVSYNKDAMMKFLGITFSWQNELCSMYGIDDSINEKISMAVLNLIKEISVP